MLTSDIAPLLGLPRDEHEPGKLLRIICVILVPVIFTGHKTVAIDLELDMFKCDALVNIMSAERQRVAFDSVGEGNQFGKTNLAAVVLSRLKDQPDLPNGGHFPGFTQKDARRAMSTVLTTYFAVKTPSVTVERIFTDTTDALAALALKRVAEASTAPLTVGRI